MISDIDEKLREIIETKRCLEMHQKDSLRKRLSKCKICGRSKVSSIKVKGKIPGKKHSLLKKESSEKF